MYIFWNVQMCKPLFLSQYYHTFVNKLITKISIHFFPFSLTINKLYLQHGVFTLFAIIYWLYNPKENMSTSIIHYTLICNSLFHFSLTKGEKVVRYHFYAISYIYSVSFCEFNYLKTLYIYKIKSDLSLSLH